MTRRDFDHILHTCMDKRGVRLDLAKVAALDAATRTEMARFVIRNRAPLLVELLTPALDPAWLASMGYLYRTTGRSSKKTFLHTCEHSIS
jgi:hypothetical protein